MYSIWALLSYYIRPLIKWFLRKTTGLCELQRICYGVVLGAPRIKAVEKSLTLSRSQQIQRMVRHLNSVCENGRFYGENQKEVVKGAVGTVLVVKRINPKIHFQFVKSFGVCVEQIWGYKQLLAEVENLRKTTYDADDLTHERKLFDLWENLMPHETLESRVTKQWQDIGFQGDDPKTDFRGMGLLGLENLLFFATEYKTPATHVLSHSHHPVYGYAFAIVGINLTSMAWQLLRDGTAKTYFYNTRSLPTLKNFHEFYCYLFYTFDQFWIECEPMNIMEFSNIRERYENMIKLALQDPASVFRIDLKVDTV